MYTVIKTIKPRI